MRRRIEKVFENAGKDLDAILLKNSSEPYLDANFFYVTGLSVGLFEESVAVSYPDLSLDVLTTQLEEESARRGREMEITVFKTREERVEILKEKLRQAKRVGVNMRGLVSSDFETLKANFPGVEFVDVSEALGNARLVKEAEEIELLSKAARIALEASKAVERSIRGGARETEIAAELNYAMQKKGAASPAFETIVAFGKNSAEAHYSPGANRIRKGDLVLADFGAKYMRYCSDITRTFAYREASRLQSEMYETVARAREAGLGAVREGVDGRSVHKAAQDVIDSTKFKGKFIHGLGHSIGLEVHDGARIAATAEVTLREGMVFTIEPGIYLPGYGGVRIEDDIVVTKEGYKFLGPASAARKIKTLP
ncbi:MAG: aminopeptidase P family protein [Candidatus Brockarchaeota archaeon]|nr:aminopeptidase P family protein [Candidatus Brockarchaeota archaeon]